MNAVFDGNKGKRKAMSEKIKWNKKRRWENGKTIPDLELTMESLSEEVLKNDWSKPEEDEVWSDL